MFILFDVTHERDRRTDRETDGHCMTAKTALASHRAVKNSPNLTLYLFCKMKTSNHCLHPLLPPDRTLNQVLRTRGHSFQLPTCSFNLHKKSFVIRGRMHDADVSASLRLKLTYDGLAD